MTIDLDVPVAAPPRPPVRRRWVAAAIALVAVAGLIAVYVGGRPPPSEVPLSHDFTGQLRWIANLVDASPRGSVAADRSFTQDLGGRVEELSESTAFGGPTNRSPERRRARVLFAEDIDDRRIILIALQRPSLPDAIRRYALTDLLWLAGPRGASAQWLADALAFASPTTETEYVLEAAEPFAAAAFGDPYDPLWVAIAPPSCHVATAPAADLTDWRDDPAGSYLIRRPRQAGPEYWRVTCDGVVREERPAPRPQLSERDLDAALAIAAGEPDRTQLGYQLSALTSTYGSDLVTVPRVVFSGGTAFSDKASGPPSIFYLGDEDDLSRPADGPIEATTTIVTAPHARGGFVSSIWTILQAGPQTLVNIGTPTFFSDARPGDPNALVAVRLDRWRRQVLVMAPESTTTMRILSRGGSVLDHSAAGDRPVMLAPGEYGPFEGLRVEALDAAGAVIAVTTLARTNVQPSLSTAWD